MRSASAAFRSGRLACYLTIPALMGYGFKLSRRNAYDESIEQDDLCPRYGDDSIAVFYQKAGYLREHFTRLHNQVPKPAKLVALLGDDRPAQY